MAPMVNSLWPLLLCIAAVAGCGDPEYPIDDVRERAAQHSFRSVTTAERFGFRSNPRGNHPHGGDPHAGDPHAGDPHGGPAVGFRDRLVWEMPDDWSELEPTQVRGLNFRVARDPATDCYMSLLPGAAGGVPANVNRWRKQMNLAPIEPAAVAKLDTNVLFGEDATFVDLSGAYSGMGGGEGKAGYRMLGLILTNGQQTLTFKMVGPEKTVSAQREAFLAIARSMRPKGPAGEAASGGQVTWKAPPTWRKGAEKKWRLVTFHPQDSEQTHCWISVLGGDGGGLSANIARWCGEMGVKPLSDDAIAKLEKVRILGRDGPLLELMGGKFDGMASASVKDAGLLGVVCVLPRRVVFVKMIGPAKVVQRERSRFLAFCETLELK